jgi:hypothetical protein
MERRAGINRLSAYKKGRREEENMVKRKILTTVARIKPSILAITPFYVIIP